MFSNNTSAAEASGNPGTVTLDAQTIASSVTNFCAATASVACLAQELAVRFALFSGELRSGDIIDADHLMARLSTAVVQAGHILEGALDLTLLSILPKEQGATMN